ncbi:MULTISPECIES: hypothetical protein [Burkholderiaceae]|uniref:hypothetical protein n=1 Tax=Burkholderiaceae TaxID=119060 RepID=UPI000A8F2E59|nr:MULTISPECIES: hypothetical protein [Burkholderiaceae]
MAAAEADADTPRIKSSKPIRAIGLSAKDLADIALHGWPKNIVSAGPQQCIRAAPTCVSPLLAKCILDLRISNWPLASDAKVTSASHSLVGVGVYMRDDLTKFELDWLFTVAICVRTSVPPFIAQRLRALGYTEQKFSQTRASDLGRKRLLDKTRVEAGLTFHDFSDIYRR